MTRDEALFELGENFNDKELGFVNNIQLICKIFNDHETAIEILMKANEEEISRHFNECEKHEAQLKAKDEEIELLKSIVEEAIRKPMGIEPHSWSDYKIKKATT